MVLNELMDSDDEKTTRGKTREWVKSREQSGYLNNIVKELKVEEGCFGWMLEISNAY